MTVLRLSERFFCREDDFVRLPAVYLLNAGLLDYSNRSARIMP